MNRNFLFVVVGLALWIGCHNRPGEEIGFGTLTNSTYRNDYFGLSINLPADWTKPDQAEQQKLFEIGAKTLAGGNKNLQKAMKTSELRAVNLFAAFKYPLSTPIRSNPSIKCAAERVSQMPEVKRGKDALFHTKNAIMASQLTVSFPQDTYREKLGGVDFDVMPLTLTAAGKAIRQKYYATIKKGYALTITVSSMNDEEEIELTRVLASLSFK